MNLFRSFRRLVSSPSPLDPEGRMKLPYFICATHRSGSSFFAEGLTQATCGEPNEYFEARLAKSWAGPWGLTPETAPIDLYREAIVRTTSPKGVFGAKVMWSQFKTLRAQLASLASAPKLDEVIDWAFPGLRYIWLRRGDQLAQAISMVRAQQTGRWHSVELEGWLPEMQKPTQSVETFDYAQIAKVIGLLQEADQRWEQYFAKNAIVPLTLTYEHLVAHYSETMRLASDYLGAELPADFAFPPPRHQKLADAVTDQWKEEYRRSEAAEAASGPGPDRPGAAPANPS